MGACDFSHILCTRYTDGNVEIGGFFDCGFDSSAHFSGFAEEMGSPRHVHKSFIER